MLTATQARVFDVEGQIENLKPFAEAEQLADAAGMKPNPWLGNMEKLRELEEALKNARLLDKARVFDTEVQAVRQARSTRERFLADLLSVEASIATYDDETRNMFAKVAAAYRWDSKVSELERRGLEKRDRLGNVIPPPGLDIDASLWAKVLALRGLYAQKINLGDNLSSTERSIQDLVRRNPALQTLLSEDSRNPAALAIAH